MRDEMAGQPRAASYDNSGGSHQWCWTHERDVTMCHRVDLDCTGETFTLHDPAGEAAVGDDPASADHREFMRCIQSAQRSADRATRILAKYQPRTEDVERVAVGRCSDCPRYCDGTRGNRLTSYKGGDPVCPACRARLDRRVVA